MCVRLSRLGVVSTLLQYRLKLVSQSAHDIFMRNQTTGETVAEMMEKLLGIRTDHNGNGSLSDTARQIVVALSSASIVRRQLSSPFARLVAQYHFLTFRAVVLFAS
jgi:hypothetical protein